MIPSRRHVPTAPFVKIEKNLKISMADSDLKLEEKYLLNGYSQLAITSLWLRVPKVVKDFTLYGKSMKNKDGAEAYRAVKVILDLEMRFVVN